MHQLRDPQRDPQPDPQHYEWIIKCENIKQTYIEYMNISYRDIWLHKLTYFSVCYTQVYTLLLCAREGVII